MGERQLLRQTKPGKVSQGPKHVRASALLDQSAELRMKLTGHKPEGEHRKYTHHEMDNLRAAVGKIPFLG